MDSRATSFFTSGSRLSQNPCNLIGCATNFPNPDPFVIRFLGIYYCYSTADAGINVLTSRDLTTWEYQGFALKVPEEHGFWAPSVIYRGGRFYMYYSSCRGEEFEWMRVASSNHPLGPFHFEKDLSACFSIDTHAIREENGDYYLFYCTDHACGNSLTRPGTAVLVDRLLDPLTLEGKPRLLLPPTMDREISGKSAVSLWTDWHTVEGPFYLRHGKSTYLLYSGNSFEREDYFIGYACCEEKDNLRDKVWQKYPGPEKDFSFCKKKEPVSGTGHNSVTKAPNLIDDWCVYHARLADQDVREQRLLFTDRILWDRNEMWLAGPTCEKRSAPALPCFADFFTEGLEQWEVVSGDWKTENGKVFQQESSVPARLRARMSFQDFVMETWLKTHLQPHGSLLGVSLHGTGNSLDFLLHEGLRQAEIVRWENGVRLLEQTICLEQDYAPFAWHCIRLEKSADYIIFYLDDHKLAEVPCLQEKVFPELYTQMCQGAFTAFSLTTFSKAEGRQLAGFFVCETTSGVFTGDEEGITYFTSRFAEGKMTCLVPLPDTYEAILDFFPLGNVQNANWQLTLQILCPWIFPFQPHKGTRYISG